MPLLRTFGFPLAVTVVGIAAAGAIGGGSIAAVVAILAVLEISLSFDNAVVNATILQRMDARWQRVFLTLGILIAVFGMRLLFPLVVVGLSGHLSLAKVVSLALNHPGEYAHKLTAAHPAIAAFGGVFLLMIFLDFVFEEREVRWLVPLENLLAKIGQLESLSAVITLVLLLVAGLGFASEHEGQVLVAGTAGLATYLGVNGLSGLFEEEGDEAAEEAADGTVADGSGEVAQPAPTAKRGLLQGGLFLFLYLEVLDASFSFDGVVGAFAITDKIFVIALGLGIGATYIRALTVYLVRKGTLAEYVYLEHGAHYAIGALAVLLFVSIEKSVPELVTGLIGIGFIALALLSSILRRRREAAAGDTGGGPTGGAPGDTPTGPVPHGATAGV